MTRREENPRPRPRIYRERDLKATERLRKRAVERPLLRKPDFVEIVSGHVPSLIFTIREHRAALAKFAGHDPDCPAIEEPTFTGPCSCGWAAIKKRFGVK